MAFRVTCTDTETGDTQTVELCEGDYILIPTGYCYLYRTEKFSNGTVVLTIKDHRPSGPARVVT